MTTLTEGNHSRDFLVSYAGQRCFEEVTLALSEDLDQGAVLGRLTKRQAAAPIPSVSGTSPGNGTMTLLSCGPDVQVGTYTLACTTAVSNGGIFSVTAPDGTVLPSATVGTAYASSHLNFLLNDSSQDFTAAARFLVVVTAAGVPAIVGTGSGAMSAITLGPQAQNGTYRVELRATSATSALAITAPDGSALPEGKVQTAYTSSHLNFTVGDGGTMTVGDYYNIIVATGTNQVKAWSSSATDGTQDVCGVLLEATDATSAAVATVALMRDAEVNASELTWRTGYTAGQKALGIAGLKALGIIARTADDA